MGANEDMDNGNIAAVAVDETIMPACLKEIVHGKAAKMARAADSIPQIHGLFDHYDSNGSGEIDADEVNLL